MVQDQLPPASIDTPSQKGGDEFASGEENRLRRFFVRLVGWIFHPPYFPSELIWILMALFATLIALDLLGMPEESWFGPHVFGIPVALLAVLLVFVVCMLLMSLLLSVINSKLVFALWIILGYAFIEGIATPFKCEGSSLNFSFINENNCSQWEAFGIFVGGLLGASVLTAASILWGIPLKLGKGDGGSGAGYKLRKGIKYGSFAWMALLVIGILFHAYPSGPVWQEITPAHTPPARTVAASTYDTGRMKAVLFGGTSQWTESEGWNSLGDTWEWDGSDWTQLFPAASPSPRRAAGMVFDEARNVALLFGGVNDIGSETSEFFDETWEWDGANWIEQKPKFHPPARALMNMYYDPVRHKVVIHGGYVQNQGNKEVTFYNDTWEWDGEVWREVVVEESPTTGISTMVYFTPLQMPIMMDGQGIWFWDIPKWHQPSFQNAPAGRWGSRMAYDPFTQQMVLFGGYKDDVSFNDTWFFDGTDWKELVSTDLPPERNGHVLFYDQVRNAIVLFGGGGEPRLNDMWELVLP